VVADHVGIHEFYQATITNAEQKGFYYSSLLAHTSERPPPKPWEPHAPILRSIFAEAPTKIGSSFQLAGGVSESIISLVEGQLRDAIRLFAPGGGTAVASLQNATQPTGQAADSLDSTVTLEAAVPVDATHLAFEFLFPNPGDGDWFTASFNDSLLFSFRGDSFVGTNAQTATVPIVNLAGQSGVFAFTLHGVGNTNADVVLSGVRFLSDSNLVNQVACPPVLGIVPAQSANEGSTLTVAVACTDQDTPLDELVISLDPGAPPGASIDATTGRITWTPTEEDGPGTKSITVRVADDSSPPLTDMKTFTVTVNEVNAPPIFSKGADQLMAEDSGAQSVANWATGISVGPVGDLGTSVEFLVSADNPGLFLVQPAINPEGTLSYTPAANTNGVAHVTVVLKDDGGTANGGQDTSDPQGFTIAVKGTQAPLVLRAVELSGGKCKFTWNAEVGRKYRVQYKASLGDAEWTDVALEIVATGSTASGEDNVSGVSQRFYHIVQVD